MKIIICDSKNYLGKRAAALGAQKLRHTLGQNGSARLVVATGASQFETLAALVKEPDVDWSRITIFHLDEYVGMSANHPASFQRYLHERFLALLPVAPAAFYGVSGEGDSEVESARLGVLISAAPIHLAFVGIGENGHLAFNDPPADFETKTPFLVVQLDDDCRRQQLGEGWFQSLDEVPTHAISMSIRQICAAQSIICSVPDARKAEAVKNCIQGPISPLAPASILQNHADTSVFLDLDSAALLQP